MQPAWQVAHNTVIALRQLALLTASLQKGLEEESFPQHIKDRSEVVPYAVLSLRLPFKPPTEWKHTRGPEFYHHIYDKSGFRSGLTAEENYQTLRILRVFGSGGRARGSGVIGFLGVFFSIIET